MGGKTLNHQISINGPPRPEPILDRSVHNHIPGRIQRIVTIEGEQTADCKYQEKKSFKLRHSIQKNGFYPPLFTWIILIQGTTHLTNSFLNFWYSSENLFNWLR